MGKLGSWFSIYLRMADGAPGDYDWEYGVDELRRAMEDAILASQEVEQEVRKHVFGDDYDRDAVVEPRLYLAVCPPDILQMSQNPFQSAMYDIYHGVARAVIRAWHDSPKVSAAVRDLIEEQRVNQLTIWEAELRPQTFLGYKASLRENSAKVSPPAYRMLDQVEGKPLKAYSRSQLDFWTHLADHDVGKNDEAWLKKLGIRSFNETVPERDTHPLSASDRWLQSIGMKPFSETFREERVAA